MSTMMSQARNRVPRFAEEALERARLSVVPRASSPRARVPFVALVSVLLVGGVAGLLFFNTSMQQVSFQATALEQKASVLEAQRQALQMELDTLRDPQRVALQARQMGMVPPASPAFIRLGDGKVLGTPLPATLDDSFRITALPTRKPKNLDPKPYVVHRPRQTLVGAAPGAPGATAGTKKTRASHTQQGSAR
jgi:cell division protein FtsB